jgi:hypothetical protein
MIMPRDLSFAFDKKPENNLRIDISLSTPKDHPQQHLVLRLRSILRIQITTLAMRCKEANKISTIGKTKIITKLTSR